jgi:hypothetical protein
MGLDPPLDHLVLGQGYFECFERASREEEFIKHRAKHDPAKMAHRDLAVWQNDQNEGDPSKYDSRNPIIPG